MQREDGTPQVLIPKKDLPKYVGLKRSKIDAMRRDPNSDFPLPIQVGDRVLVWAEEEIYEWQQRLFKNRKRRAA